MTPGWGGAALLGLLTVHAAAWMVQAAWLWDGYERLRQGGAGAWTDEGVTARGWLRPSLMAQKPVLTVTTGVQDVSWSAKTAVLTLTPSGVALSGPQRLSWGGVVVASTDSLVVSAGPRWSGVNLILSAAAMQAATWEASWDGATLAASASGIATGWPGPTAHVSGRVTPAGMTWRMQDGVARWGELALSGSATLEWGAAMPALTGMLTITGHGAGLDNLVHAGVVTPSAAQAMRGVLDTLAKASPLGLAVPVALRDGLLTVAGFPLLRVEWPN